MINHPAPWHTRCGYVKDSNGIAIYQILTPDPETRAVLLHAAEMWAEVKRASEGNGTYDVRWANAVELRRKIESEIAAAKGKP